MLTVALARLGVVQNPILPGEWRGFDDGAMAEGIAAGSPGLAVLDVSG